MAAELLEERSHSNSQEVTIWPVAGLNRREGKLSDRTRFQKSPILCKRLVQDQHQEAKLCLCLAWDPGLVISLPVGKKKVLEREMRSEESPRKTTS